MLAFHVRKQRRIDIFSVYAVAGFRNWKKNRKALKKT
jgi:hypothetical protein